MDKDGPMQPGEAHGGILAQPRRHRNDKAPRDHRILAKEPHLQLAGHKPHQVARHAVVDRYSAGYEAGRVGGGDAEDVGVEAA